MISSAVLTSIHDTSPLLGVGAGLASSFFSSAAGFAAAGAGGLSCASAAPPKASAVVSAMKDSSFFMSISLKRVGVGLAGADADDFFQIEDEDLAVADLSGIGGFLDRLDRPFEQLGLDRGVDPYLGQEIDHVLRAAVELGVALLPAAALHLRPA